MRRDPYLSHAKCCGIETAVGGTSPLVRFVLCFVLVVLLAVVGVRPGVVAVAAAVAVAVSLLVAFADVLAVALVLVAIDRIHPPSDSPDRAATRTDRRIRLQQCAARGIGFRRTAPRKSRPRSTGKEPQQLRRRFVCRMESSSGWIGLCHQ